MLKFRLIFIKFRNKMSASIHIKTRLLKRQGMEIINNFLSKTSYASSFSRSRSVAQKTPLGVALELVRIPNTNFSRRLNAEGNSPKKTSKVISVDTIAQ